MEEQQLRKYKIVFLGEQNGECSLQFDTISIYILLIIKNKLFLFSW
jgi:hypothetical protein